MRAIVAHTSSIRGNVVIRLGACGIVVVSPVYSSIATPIIHYVTGFTARWNVATDQIAIGVAVSNDALVMMARADRPVAATIFARLENVTTPITAIGVAFTIAVWAPTTCRTGHYFLTTS
jgi:hypothetical protein